jgi:hypothetical protein
MQPGIFDLRTPADLLKKLEHDFDAVLTQENAYTAFNFFITAHHLHEWVRKWPSPPALPLERPKDSPILAVIAQIANGAKHFQTDHRHDSVADTASCPW